MQLWRRIGGEEVQTHLVCFQRTVDTEQEPQPVYLHENIFCYLSVISRGLG